MTPPIGKNNISTAMSTLGITRYEANQLDALDGKTDGKIKKDIFTEAQELLAFTKEEYANDTEDHSNEPINVSGNKVSHAIAASLARAAGYGGYVFNKKENKELTEEEWEIAEDMDEVCSEASDYVEEKKSLKNFETTTDGDVTITGMQVEQYADPNFTNKTTFDENGQAQTEYGGRITRMNYTANGEEYELGYLWGI